MCILQHPSVLYLSAEELGGYSYSGCVLYGCGQETPLVFLHSQSQQTIKCISMVQ